MFACHRDRLAVALVVFFCVHDAAAQDARGGKAPPQPGAHQGQGARTGDCNATIDRLDAALRSAITPELYRERGKCHDQLGHPFPAIDDYRAYLTARPSAPDADAIRARVEELESEVGIVKRGEAGVSSKTGADVSTSIGGETDLGEGGGALEKIEQNEQLDAEADGSSLRRGRGLILGVTLAGRDFTSSTFGGGELVGLDLRYSFSAVSTILIEGSIGHVNGTGTATSMSGPGILAGYEARIHLNPRVSDALLVGATFRYESYSESGGFVYAMLEPEGRFGYRHVWGPTLGLEAVVDGGVAVADLTGTGTTTVQGLLGTHVAVLLGF
jgi:hypothetical protein